MLRDRLDVRSTHSYICATATLNAKIKVPICLRSRSQWPRGLRCGSAADRLLGLRVRIPPVAWMSVSCECCVLSGRGLCYGLITRPEESYRLWCVSDCDREALIMKRPWPHWGLSRHWNKICLTKYKTHRKVSDKPGTYSDISFP
jgi:hypothetical protein